MNKKSMTEADVHRQFVTPALVGVNEPKWDSATQIGLKATSKETKDVSNIEYFDDPIYTYSLRQGIADGMRASKRLHHTSTNVKFTRVTTD